MKQLMKKFVQDERGLETVEWAVVAALLVLGAVAVFKLLGATVSTKLNALDTEINT